MGTKNEQPLASKSGPLGACEEPVTDKKVGAFVMVIFGGAGDLAQRKLLPALYNLYDDGAWLEEFAVLGVGRAELLDDTYRGLAESAIKRIFPGNIDQTLLSEFTRRLYFLCGSLEDDEVYEDLCHRLNLLSQPIGPKNANILFYLAVPPQLFPVIVEKLDKFHLCGAGPKRKLIVEKPFGLDRDSAATLNRLILKTFDEKQVFRIDHYLAKDTVQNILFFRFGNSMFEPLWNTRYIDHVQITVAEDIGIEHRGPFYEQVGVVRDIVQNHLLQLVALVAMEPPASFEADLIRDEKLKVFHSLRRMDDDYIESSMVRGQYGPGMIANQPVAGYREEPKVSGLSNVPTFFAGKFYIDNWRWAGVPFYLRTGKRLARRVSEIYIEFKKLPLRLFGKTCEIMKPNSLILRLQPEEEICLRLIVKYPGIGDEPSVVNMEFNYEKSFKVKQYPAYERVLADCIRGDLTLFLRQDAVDMTWAILDPLLKFWESRPPLDFPNYHSGTWGPRQALLLIEKERRRWRFSDGET